MHHSTPPPPPAPPPSGVQREEGKTQPQGPSYQLPVPQPHPAHVSATLVTSLLSVIPVSPVSCQDLLPYVLELIDSAPARVLGSCRGLCFSWKNNHTERLCLVVMVGKDGQQRRGPESGFPTRKEQPGVPVPSQGATVLGKHVVLRHRPATEWVGGGEGMQMKEHWSPPAAFQPPAPGLSPEFSFISLLQAGETGTLSPADGLGLLCTGLKWRILSV